MASPRFNDNLSLFQEIGCKISTRRLHSLLFPLRAMEIRNTHLLLHSNFGMSWFVMMRCRSDHRIRMMAKVALSEWSILLDLCAGQDQRSRAVWLQIHLSLIRNYALRSRRTGIFNQLGMPEPKVANQIGRRGMLCQNGVNYRRTKSKISFNRGHSDRRCLINCRHRGDNRA